MSNEDNQNSSLEVFGALLHGYAQACLNLNIVAGNNATALTSDIEVMHWYPFDRLKKIEEIVLKTYRNSEPIMERVGEEMMKSWYNYGPGKQIIKNGLDFIYYQSGSQGYASVVKGPDNMVGNFKLEEIDLEKGTAIIHSTTPLDRNMEKGVIVGGMNAPGDLIFVDVNNDEDKDYFKIEFH